MEQAYTMRPYKKGDENSIIHLLTLVFPGWGKPSPIDYWRWKYIDTPTKEYDIVVAESDNKIVGVIHGYPVVIKIGDKLLSTVESTDLAVHPDFRKLGIFKKLSEYKTELDNQKKLSLSWAVTGNPIVFDSNMRWGRSTFPYPPKALIHVKNIGLHTRVKKLGLAMRIGAVGINYLNRLRYSLQSSPTILTSIKISQIKQFDDRVNLLWDSLSMKYDFMQKRDMDYLNWRYMDSRGGDFIVKIAEDGNELLGYSVLYKLNDIENYSEGLIMDLIAKPGREDVTYTLINDSINYFDDNKINIIYTMVVENHPYEMLYKKRGFFDSRKSFKYTIFQPLNVGEEWKQFMNAKPDRLFFQYGDIDYH